VNLGVGTLSIHTSLYDYRYDAAPTVLFNEFIRHAGLYSTHLDWKQPMPVSVGGGVAESGPTAGGCKKCLIQPEVVQPSSTMPNLNLYDELKRHSLFPERAPGVQCSATGMGNTQLHFLCQAVLRALGFTLEVNWKAEKRCRIPIISSQRP
jgi:hypothetical protein